MSFKTKASIAVLAGALALTGVACGDDNSSDSTASGAGAATNKVTAIPSLTGVGTSVKIDAGTAEALKSLGVALAPSGSATFEASTSTITFPITSGYAEIHSDLNVKPGYIQGSIAHEGSGFSLSAGSTKVQLSDFVVDPGNSVLYGTVGGTPKVPLLSLDGTNVKVSMEGSNVVLQATVAKLTATAAGALNKAFNVSALNAGIPLGTVRLQAKGAATTYDAVADKTARISRLDGTNVKVSMEGSDVVLQGTVAKLTATGAGALNATFGVSDFKEGIPLGVVRLVAAAPAAS